jgi:hypothetical protein
VVKAAKYIAVLGAALAAVSALAGAVAARRYGAGAYEASAVAAAINWIAGSVALAAIFASRNQPWRTHAALLAMGVRMALPLASLAYFHRSHDPLAAHGVVGLILVHYLVGLVIETVMSVRVVGATGAGTTGSPGTASPGTARLAGLASNTET